MGEGLLHAIGRFITASTYDYLGPNFSNLKKTLSPILPRGGALALSHAMCALASRAQNRQKLLEAGAPHSIVRLLVDAISRRRRLDYDLNVDDVDDAYPTEELGPVKLEKLQKEQDAETGYLRALSKSCLNMLSFFLADSIAAMPNIQPSGSKTMGISPPSASSFGGSSTASSDQKQTVVDILTHPHVIDAVKYICNQPKGTARLAALRVVSMLVEWPGALDAVYTQRISDILVSSD